VTHGYDYSPAKNPAQGTMAPDWGCTEQCCAAATPGGTTNRVMWDEKGVLDSNVYRVAQAPAGQSLPAAHDAHKQGIYKTNSVGDYD